MADESKGESKEGKAAKPVKPRGNERPAWAMHNNPANPGKGPGGHGRGAFVQRSKKAHGRGS